MAERAQEMKGATMPAWMHNDTLTTFVLGALTIVAAWLTYDLGAWAVGMVALFGAFGVVWVISRHALTARHRQQDGQ